MDSIFNKDFWIKEWAGDKKGDTYNVHKGFSTPEYWDKAASTYNLNETEVRNRRLEKTIDFFKRSNLLFDGMKVLDIGCGTGMLAIELARHGADVTALDFSKGMLKRFQQDIPPELEKHLTILCEDWHQLDIQKKGWVKAFDLVIAFMSPGVATPESFFKMMDCSKKGCAMRGWAAKRNHPVMSVLWEKIQGTPLKDKPQSIFFKINLIFAMGFFPEITFDTIEWKQNVTVQEEFDNQMAFFKKASNKPDSELEAIIQPYLDEISENNRIIREHIGYTATAVWVIDQN